MRGAVGIIYVLEWEKQTVDEGGPGRLEFGEMLKRSQPSLHLHE